MTCAVRLIPNIRLLNRPRHGHPSLQIMDTPLQDILTQIWNLGQKPNTTENENVP